MAIQYAVDAVIDDHGALRDRLAQIAEDGGRVINVIWQPERPGADCLPLSSGYTIVSEVDI